MSTTIKDLLPKRLTPGDLQRLAKTSANPCVSILMRTHCSGPETQQGAIRFKNLLGEAREKLDEAGHDSSILHPIESLSDNFAFWQHQSYGLAIFLTPDDCRLIRLDRTIPDMVCVGESFMLSPLVPHRHSGTSYFVLSLTWDEARLFRSDGERLEPVETDALPATFSDLVLPRDPEESLQNTSHRSPSNVGGASKAMFHGQGEGEDKIEADRNQYLSLVGDQVAGVVYNSGLPLVVNATEEVIGHFQACADVTVDAQVCGSPSQWSDVELQQRVQDVIAGQSFAAARDDSERFSTAISQSRGSAQVSEILSAAEQGRVESVMIGDGESDTEKRLNAIIVETLRHSGEVFRCDSKDVPGDQGVAAIFRF